MTFTPFVLLAFALIAYIGAANPAAAQDYPAKPIRVIVPFPAGGGTDIVARTILLKLSENLGLPIVIDNRGGAGGTIGTEIVAKASADGYTLALVSSSHAINPSLLKKLPYDTLQDFAPVTMLVTGPGVLALHPSIPARTVKELIALAKSKPGELTYASAGIGTPPHLAAELFKTIAGVDIVHVPYKGAAPAYQDLIGGRVSMSFFTIPSTLPHVRSGKLRALAVTGSERSRIAPEIPTLAESGLAGYDASSWYGIVAPAGTPAAIVGKLHREIAKVLQLANIRETLLNQGLDTVASTPREFAATIKSEMVKWAKIVQASGARVE